MFWQTERGTNYAPEIKVCQGDPLKPQDEQREKGEKKKQTENLKGNRVCDKQKRIKK